MFNSLTVLETVFKFLVTLRSSSISNSMRSFIFCKLFCDSLNVRMNILYIYIWRKYRLRSRYCHVIRSDEWDSRISDNWIFDSLDCGRHCLLRRVIRQKQLCRKKFYMIICVPINLFSSVRFFQFDLMSLNLLLFVFSNLRNELDKERSEYLWV